MKGSISLTPDFGLHPWVQIVQELKKYVSRIIQKFQYQLDFRKTATDNIHKLLKVHCISSRYQEIKKFLKIFFTFLFVQCINKLENIQKICKVQTIQWAIIAFVTFIVQVKKELLNKMFKLQRFPIQTNS